MAAIEKEMLFISRYFIIIDLINQNGNVFDILSFSELLTELILTNDHTKKSLVQNLNRTSRLLLRSVNENITASILKSTPSTYYPV